ncbi:co-chaperone GroES [bacterium (Candidatus Torokbacteria) CG09_land_8_20_14_0_10_42_11]|nr:MAG: co-chaperone GroES [bacterium (Candidatus Torokbacteria) CG09_land_8_20_14_0_10_42_11]
MMIQPLEDKVVIKPLALEEKTSSGIILPDTAEKEKPEQGKVLAVGLGKMLDSGSRAPMSVKKGDTVLFTKYSPNEIKVDGKELLIIAESDILAIIK